MNNRHSYMLDSDKVGTNERHVVVICTTEHANNTSVVDSRSENSQKVVEEHRLLLQIESQGLVVAAERYPVR